MSRAPSPAGRGAARRSAPPRRSAAPSGREQELDAVLARVAGAADERLGAGDRAASPCACAAAARRRRARRRSSAPRAPGRRASRSRRSRRATSASKPAACSREPGEVALVVGGVGDRQVAVVGQPVGEQVVEDAAVLAAEHRVLGAADLELRETSLESSRWRSASASRPGGLDLAHVRDVEDAAARAHREVLRAHALVLNRHLPARERHQLRARRRRGPRRAGCA